MAGMIVEEMQASAVEDGLTGTGRIDAFDRIAGLWSCYPGR